jgi:hypothetical protein
VTSSKVIVKQTGEHSHSNRLVERKVKEVEQENIAAAALLPTVAPRSILGAIAVNLETIMSGHLVSFPFATPSTRLSTRLANN